MKDDLMYRVGPLLYMPGLREDIARKLAGLKTDFPMSAALCLEDTIRDDMVGEAEKNAAAQMRELYKSTAADSLPLIFIRVRSPGQIRKMTEMLGESAELLSGFILPKIDDETICEYKNEICSSDKRLLFMPIIENPSLLELKTRYARLSRLKNELDGIRDRILNIRIGGNDFCRALSLRCAENQTIYELLPVARMLSDIAVTFTADYVVSAPVWNYFDNGTDGAWKKGLEREMAADRAMGFIGKTVIHPSQLKAAAENMKVTRRDYSDAMLILSTEDSAVQVVKGTGGNCMYEHKIHSGWAERTAAAARIYGIREEM